jgi:hypothetical protein
MTVRVMSAGLPTTRYEDQNSPVLDGIGRAAQTLLELGPKLSQIQMEKDRLALDQQREQRVQDRDLYERGRQGVLDQRAQIKEAPSAFRATPSLADNALAEQVETENAAHGIRPSNYTEGLPRTPQQGVPLSGFAAALDEKAPLNPFVTAPMAPEPDRGALYDKLGAINAQNELSHKPVQSREGATYEDTMRIKNVPIDKLNKGQEYRDKALGIKGRMADIAQERVDNQNNNAETRHDLDNTRALQAAYEAIDRKYAPKGSFDMRTDAQIQSDERKRIAERAQAEQLFGVAPPAAAAAPDKATRFTDLLNSIKNAP